METVLFKTISELLSSGAVSADVVLLLIIGLSVLAYRVVKPLKDKLDSIRVIDNTALISGLNALLVELTEKITLMTVSDSDHHRELELVRRDVEHIREILNQFQGSMMYNAGFGNRELR